MVQSTCMLVERLKSTRRPFGNAEKCEKSDVKLVRLGAIAVKKYGERRLLLRNNYSLQRVYEIVI
jgi:hypothetical protein